MRQPLLWFLLGAIVIALIVLVTHHDEGMIGPLSTGDFASLSYRLVLLVFIASVVVVMFRGRIMGECVAHASQRARIGALMAGHDA